MARSVAFGLAALVAVSGCADLRDLDSGVCGNGIVEANEDCDGPGSDCGRPETTNACRILCSSSLACPDNFQCGSDGVCRFATGRFELANELQSEQDVFTDLADMDGDGIRDLVSMDPSAGIRVSYLDARATVVTTVQIPASFAPPSVGQLTDSEAVAQQAPRSDLVDVPGGAINVLRGRSDRTLAPTSYSSLPVNDTVAYAALDARPPDGEDFYGDEILSFAGTSVRGATDSVPLFSLPFDVQNLPGPIVHGHIDNRLAPSMEPLSPWEEFVLTEWDGNAVYVYSPSKWKSFVAKKAGWNDDPNVYPPVTMPANGRVQSRPFLIDLNGDQWLDLVVAGTTASGPGGGIDLYVAFGRNDGSFHSDANSLPPEGQAANQTFYQVGVTLPSIPLDVGFLNSDTKLDLVLPGGVLLSGLGPSDCFQVVPGYSCIKSADDWNAAKIGHFNGTAGLDIIAASSASRALEFWNNTGNGSFHRFSIPTKNFPSRLTIGDFDGDLLQDVAIVESKYQTYAGSGPSVGIGGDPDQRDTLAVLFGRPFGAPEPPAAVGQLGAIESVVAGRIDASDDFDDLTDLGVLSSYFDEESGQSRSVAVFLGSTNRLLSAPFQLSTGTTNTEADVALRTWLGDFNGDDHADIGALAFDLERLSSNGQFVLRGWHLPSTGEAELSEKSAKFGADADASFDYCAALGTTIDLGNDGRDEIVFLGRKRDKDKNIGGALTTWRVDGSGTWVSPDPPADLPLLFSAAPLERFPCEAVRSLGGGGNSNNDELSTGQAFAAEVDEQPGLDMVALGFDDKTKLSLMVLLQRDGNLDVQDPIVLPPPEGKTLQGVLPIQADQDLATEVLLLTTEGIELAEIDLGARALVVVRQVFETGFFGGPEPLPGTPPGPSGGDEPFSVGGIGTAFGSYLSAATGDINGDGLEDFSFVHGGSLRVFLALDTRRTDAP